jgi:hypothetical protein
MTSRSPDAAANSRPLVLSPAEIDELLSMTLIANLATLDNDGSIHLLPMWFLRVGDDIYIPTSSQTHKYRNLRMRPRASVMIDLSRAGLNLKGVLIRGKGRTHRRRGSKEDQSLNPFEVCESRSVERRQRCLLPFKRRRHNCEGTH